MSQLVHIDRVLGLMPSCPRHAHSTWMIIIYVRGRGMVVFDDNEIPYRVGTIVCIPPGISYEETSDYGFRSLFIACTEMFAGARGVIHLEEGADRALQRLGALILAECRGARRITPFAQGLFEALLLAIRDYPRPTTAHDPVERMRIRIAAAVEDASYAIGSAIAELPGSPSALRRAFLRRHGMTPRGYLHHLRLEKAKRLLAIDGFSIKQIAHAAGFRDPHYFSRLFHSRVGAWPMDFRRSRLAPGSPGRPIPRF